ncbi:PadR family transcriptional regulator, partial [Nocardia sp. NPDC059154]
MPEDNARRPLNSTAASLLGFLHQGELSGWDLVALAQDRIGDFWTITQSQVYRELATMHQNGLVDKGAAGARDRTPYRITEDGREAFAEWIARDPGAETIRV